MMVSLALIILVGVSVADSVQEERKALVRKVSVFVGPQTRGGFLDVDSGILDSIKDIQEELRRLPQISVASSPGEAKIVLIVVARRTPGDSGGIGFPIGAGMTMTIPIKRRAIETLLRAGKYEKSTTSEAADGDDRWKSAAKTVAKDVAAWVEANRVPLEDRE